MIIAFYIVAGLAALVFLFAGATKLVRPRAALQESGMAWAEDFTDGPVKLIGAAEVLGAIGLILPVLTGVAPILSPIAGVALAILMVGAVTVHARRKENAGAAIGLLVVALVAAVLGFLVVL